MKLRGNIDIVVAAFLWLLIVSPLLFSASTPRIPVRTPPTPPGMIEGTLPSKKAQQARLLREAAEAMEDEARRELSDLGAVISNKVSAVNFASDKFDVRMESVSFMEVREKLVMQITLGYKEK